MRITADMLQLAALATVTLLCLSRLFFLRRKASRPGPPRP
jgi:hypothetical protein